MVTELEALRITVEYLWDGNDKAFGYLTQIKAHFPERNNEILLWLAVNKQRGSKLVDFFENEKDDDLGLSVVNGVARIFNSIDGTSRKVVEVPIDKLYKGD